MSRLLYSKAQNNIKQNLQAYEDALGRRTLKTRRMNKSADIIWKFWIVIGKFFFFWLTAWVLFLSNQIWVSRVISPYLVYKCRSVFLLLFPKIQQTKMLVTCQNFGDLFLFGLVWQYYSVQYNNCRFKVRGNDIISVSVCFDFHSTKVVQLSKYVI